MSQQINLCNPLFRKQKKYFSALTMAQSLGLVVLGYFLFYGYLIYQSKALTQQAQQMSRMHDATQRQLTTMATTYAARQPDKLLTDTVTKTEQEVRTRLGLIDLLNQGELGNQTGFSEYFKALSRQTISGLWLTGFEVVGAGNQVSLSGRALQAGLVANWLQRLKTEPKFAGTSFATLDIHQPLAPPTAAGTPSEPLPYIEFSLGKPEVEQPK